MTSRLSPNFTLEEFTLSQEAERTGIDNTPPPDVVARLVKTAAGMERIRTATGNRPIFVSSGYRSLKLNTRIGGSKTSAHVKGEACDFTVAGLTPRQAAEIIVKSGVKFDQLILEFNRWLHAGFSEPMRQQVLTAKKINGKTVYLPGLVD
jgi:hypothetical protein